MYASLSSPLPTCLPAAPPSITSLPLRSLILPLSLVSCASRRRELTSEFGRQVATIDGFRHNLVGANNHSMVFDGCVSCQRSGAKSCERCRKSLQLRGKPFTILRPDAVTAVRSTTLSHRPTPLTMKTKAR